MDKKPQLIAKEETINVLRGKFQEANTVLLTDYKGISVSEDTILRRKLREVGVVYGVSKNTLIKRAANDEGITALDEYLEGTTSISFTNDPAALAKIIAEFSKGKDCFKVKAGILEGKLITSADIENIAKLPSREVLLSQVVGGMQSPIVGFAVSLQAVISGFVRCLDQVREQKAQ